MNVKLILSTVAALLAGVSASSAADLAARPYTKAPAVVMNPVYSWTGFYIGVNGGGGWGKESWLDNDVGIADLKPQGGVVGGQLGFRYQVNQFVFGLEGSADWASLSNTISGGGYTDQLKVKSLYTATGQVGLAFDRGLVYAKGGWAGASTDAVTTLVGCCGASNSQTNTGWVVGGGLEYAVWQNITLGVEYDHFSLGYKDFVAPYSNGGAPWVVTNSTQLNIDQVVGRLTYHFNWGGPVVAKY